jgi:hypothetical protein
MELKLYSSAHIATVNNKRNGVLILTIPKGYQNDKDQGDPVQIL